MARYRPPDHVPPDLLGNADFVRACARRDLGALFRLTNMQYPEFTVSHLGRRCDMSVNQVGDYMKRGRTARDLSIFERVSDGLHIPGRMFGINPRPWEEAASALVVTNAASDESTRDLADATSAWDTGELESAEEAEIMLMVQEADRTDIGPTTIESLYAVFDKLCRDYPSAAAPDLRQRLKRLYSRVMKLRQGRITLGQHRELIAISGWITALLACVDWDMNEREAAETARNATFRFAQDVGHSELVAWSHELQAWFALTEGRYGDVTNIASAATAAGGENSAIVQLTMQEARGWARLGNRTATESAMERGYALLQRLPAVNYPRHFVYDRTKFSFYVASCYQWLGDDEKAEEHANQVFRECTEYGTTERSPMRLAETNITLGLVHAQRRNLDGAVEYGSRALSYKRKSGPSLLIRAAELDKAIAAAFPGARETLDFNEKFRAVCDEFDWRYSRREN